MAQFNAIRVLNRIANRYEWRSAGDNSLITDPAIIAQLESDTCQPCCCNSSFDSERLTDGAATPTFPPGTREVTVSNYSTATIEITTDAGTQIVGPNQSIHFAVCCGQELTAVGSAVIAGTFGPADQVLYNYGIE